jgi:hypothetical protein
MKHLKSINEYQRTIGFRYSPPKESYNIDILCQGEDISEDKIILGLSKVNDLIYDKDSIEVTVLDDGTFFNLPEDRGEVEIDAIAHFNITVYNEREIVTIVEELGKKILSAYNIENIVHDVIENHVILKNFGKDVITNFKEEGIKYFNKYVNQSYEIIIKDVLKYYYTWDNYQLSICYLKIIIGMHRSLKKQNKFVIDFMKLLVSNIHVNPLKRLSIEATTNKFELLIENTELDEFKQLIRAL